MTANRYKAHLIDLALEVKDDFIEEFSPSENPECELCGARKFKADRVESRCVAESYFVDCPYCDGSLSFTHFLVEIGSDIPIVNQDFKGVDCSSTNCNPPADPHDAVENNDPFQVLEYELPVKGILTTSIHEHHVSYIPEETMTVCSQCHAKIHSQDDFHPELKPEMKRSEWEATDD